MYLLCWESLPLLPLPHSHDSAILWVPRSRAILEVDTRSPFHIVLVAPCVAQPGAGRGDSSSQVLPASVSFCAMAFPPPARSPSSTHSSVQTSFARGLFPGSTCPSPPARGRHFPVLATQQSSLSVALGGALLDPLRLWFSLPRLFHGCVLGDVPQCSP